MGSIKTALLAWGISLVVLGGLYGYVETFGPDTSNTHAPGSDHGEDHHSDQDDDHGDADHGEDHGDDHGEDHGDDHDSASHEASGHDDVHETGGHEDGHADSHSDSSHETDTDAAALPGGSSTVLPAVVPTDVTAKPVTVVDIPAAPGPYRVDANLEEARQGDLPKISDAGARPFDVYRTPAPDNRQAPRIALIITDLGLRARTTQRAIAQLPHQISFAFSPYGTRLSEWADASRASGHELLISVPMEPSSYPQDDPGPLALMTSQSVRDNLNLLRSSLGSMTGYVGVVNHMGSRFTTTQGQIQPIIEELAARGLMIVDARTSRQSLAASLGRTAGMPVALNDSDIDREPRAADIRARLDDLEATARKNRAAIGIGRAFPVTITAIQQWSDGLAERGILLVPISHVADLQPRSMGVR